MAMHKRSIVFLALTLSCILIAIAMVVYGNAQQAGPDLPPLVHIKTEHDDSCWVPITDGSCSTTYYYIGYGSVSTIIGNLQKILPQHGYVVGQPQTIGNDTLLNVYQPKGFKKYSLEFFNSYNPPSAADGRLAQNAGCNLELNSCSEVIIVYN